MSWEGCWSLSPGGRGHRSATLQRANAATEANYTVRGMGLVGACFRLLEKSFCDAIRRGKSPGMGWDVGMSQHCPGCGLGPGGCQQGPDHQGHGAEKSLNFIPNVIVMQTTRVFFCLFRVTTRGVLREGDVICYLKVPSGSYEGYGPCGQERR